LASGADGFQVLIYLYPKAIERLTFRTEEAGMKPFLAILRMEYGQIEKGFINPAPFRAEPAWRAIEP